MPTLWALLLLPPLLPTWALQGRPGVVAAAQNIATSDRKVSAPAAGDIAFFRNTTVGSDGGVTHVALVERIDADGTVLLLQRLSNGVRESRMNLASPHDPARNSYLKRSHTPGQPVLSGELFVAYGRP